MKVTPLDIRRKEFKRSMRGYSDEEVDLFLDEVADELEQLSQANAELQERIRRVEEQLAGNVQLRDALEKTLVSAQLQADETRANARKESESILQDAELKARSIVNESYAEVQRIQQALIQLKRLEEDFQFKFRSLLEGHLKLLDEAPVSMPTQPVVESAPSPTPETPFVIPAAVVEVPEYPQAAPAAVQAEPTPVTEAATGELAAEAMISGSPLAASPLTDAELPGAADRPTAISEPVLASQPAPAPQPAPDQAAPGRSPEAEAPDDWGTDEFAGASGDTETVEQASIFAEFDKIDARRRAEAGGPPMAADAEDPLRGFFLSGRSDGTEETFPDAGKGGKSKARDFEW